MVGAGAIVTRDVPPYALVIGNPARVAGYVQSRKVDVPRPLDRVLAPAETSGVKGVRLMTLPFFRDMRGSLSVAEAPDNLPFIPRRIFMVYDVPNARIRGEHAHRTCEQLLICVSGSCHVMVEDGVSRADIELSSPEQALYIPPMIWTAQYRYSQDAVLMVAASHEYDGADYIRHYREWCEEVAN